MSEVNDWGSAARRIAEDWKYACENWYQVVDRNPSHSRALTYLKWNRGQRKLADVILRQEAKRRPVRVVLLKSRQFGGSTVIQSWLFRRATTRPNQSFLTIGGDAENAKHLQGISRMLYRRLPAPLRPMITYDTKEELYWANPDARTRDEEPGLESRMICETARDMSRSSTVEGALMFRRGEMFTGLHGSECALWPDPDRLMQAVLSAVPDRDGTFVALESTANMRGDPFHRICRAAREGKSEFEFVFVPWFEVGTDEYECISKETILDLTEHEEMLREKHGVSLRQILWRRSKLASMQFRGDEQAFLREYPEDPETCFTVSGSGVFAMGLRGAEASLSAPVVCGDLTESKVGEVVVSEQRDGELRIFELPKPREYTIGADVSEGLSQDSDCSAAVVLNRSGQVAATYLGRIEPGAFGQFLALLGRYYNNAYLAVERNGAGVATLEVLSDLYDNLYQEPKTNGQYGQKTSRIGWRTTSTSKPLMIRAIQTWLHDNPAGEAALLDSRLLEALGTFVRYPDGKTGGSPGCSDDLVVAYGIALKAMEDVGFGTDRIVCLGRRTDPLRREAPRPLARVGIVR